MCVLRLFSSVQLFVTPWIIAHQAPLSMGFFRQGYWSELPFPSLGYLPDPGIEPMSPALASRFFTTSDTWEASNVLINLKKELRKTVPRQPAPLALGTWYNRELPGNIISNSVKLF